MDFFTNFDSDDDGEFISTLLNAMKHVDNEKHTDFMLTIVIIN